MRKSYLIITSIYLLLLTSFSFSQPLFQRIEYNPSQTLRQVQEAAEEQWGQQPYNERRGWKNFKRWEWFWEARSGEKGEFPNVGQLYTEWLANNAKVKPDQILSTKVWKQLGPFGEPEAKHMGAQGIGRVNIIRSVQGKSGVLFAGTAGGGLWKSTNLGQSWSKLPFPEFLTLGIADIAISQSNPNIIYVSTGDAFGAGAVSVQVNSIGVVKSTDGGNSWQITGFSQQLANGRVLARCLVHPTNPNIAYLAASDGVYKTTDGGANWGNTLAGTFIDMEFHPSNPDIIYASTRKWGTNEIYKTSNAGQNWKEVRRFTSSRRIAIAVSEANAKNVYAVVATTGRAFHSFAVSYDEGENWDVPTTQTPNILGRDFGADRAGQGEYDLALAVAPYDEDLIVVGGINLWKSNDGGYSWKQISHWYGGNGFPFVHADHHDLYFDNETGALFSAHDGGIDLSYDEGRTWREASDGMSIMQIYRFSNSATNQNFVVVGSQDNGSNMYRNGKWTNTYGGDGMDCIINPIDPNRVYISLYNGELRRSVDGGDNYVTMLSSDMTGENGAWVTPYIIDPQDPSTLYAGYRNVFKLTNHGASWSKISTFTGNQLLISMAIAPSDRKVIYAATYSTMNVTYDGGNTWSTISGLPGGMSYIAVDPKNPRRIWVTSTSYSSARRIVEYDGNSVKDITGNLPNLGVNSVVYQKDSPDRLYIGTDAGVYYSDYTSGNWIKYGTQLPNLVVTELEIQYAAKKLRAATYGGGVWETDILTCNLPQPSVTVIGNTTICPGDTVILRCETDLPIIKWSNGETSKEINVTEAGTYYVTASDGECESTSQTFEIKIFSTPNMIIRATQGYPYCEGEEVNVQLTATTVLFDSWLWSTGETKSSININTPGSYYVQGTTKDGCIVKSDTFRIAPMPLPDTPVIIWANHNTLMTTSEFDKYQWYLDGNPIENAVQRFYTIKDSGMHSVEVFNEYNCSSISQEIHILSSVIEFLDGTEVIVYPNPSSGMFNIQLSNSNSKISYTIRDVLGVELLSKSDLIGNTIEIIDLSKFPSGLYMLEIKYSGMIKFVKLIKD